MKYMASLLLLVIAVIVSVFSGRYPVSFDDIYKILHLQFQDDSVKVFLQVVINMRLPRILAAMVVGSSLSVAGSVYQGIFRNPMVSPALLGASSGAAFGAALGILLGLSMPGTELLSFLFGMAAVAITLSIAAFFSDSKNSVILVLSGILISTIFSSLISLIKFIADPYTKLPDITFWLLGGLAGVSMSGTLFAAGCLLAGFTILFAIRWKINILTLSEEEAVTMGINTGKYRIIIIASATLLTSSVVCISGLIGWVGLIVPHIARMIFGPDYRNLLWAALIIGSVYLLMVDNIARCVSGVEIPLGILTSLIGAPFFIFIMIRTKRGWA